MRRALVAATTVLAGFTWGCSAPTSPLDLVGTYSLKSVSGMPLPYQLPQAGSITVHVLDDLLILTPSGTYSEVGHKLVNVAGSVSVETPIDAGNFRRRGDAITMESLLIGTWTGTVGDDGALRMTQQGLTLEYRR